MILQHHWSDVSAGALIGVVAASLTARYVSGLIAPSKSGEDVNRDVSLNPPRNYDVEAPTSVPKVQNEAMLER